MYYYASVKDDAMVENKLLELASKRPTRGFGHYFGIIRNEGLIWNHKRVKRVYKKLGLNKRRKVKRRVPTRVQEPIVIPNSINESWSMDFIHDVMENGRKVKFFNVIDDYNREILTIDVGTSITGERVTRSLEEIISWRGKPKEIRVDNGPEFTSAVFAQFCLYHEIRIKFIQPGKPVQNALIERFNRTFREDVLDAHIFENFPSLRHTVEEFIENYNNEYPHQSLNGKSPKKYLTKSNNVYF